MSMDITLTNAYKSYVHGHNSDKGIWGFEPPRPQFFRLQRSYPSKSHFRTLKTPNFSRLRRYMYLSLQYHLERRRRKFGNILSSNDTDLPL